MSPRSPFLVLSALLVSCSAPTAREPAASAPATRSGAAAPASFHGAPDTGDTRLLEQPAASATQLAFVYAGDLWSANLDGTNARRLTTHPGQESRPRFSPDGKWIAFSGQYDGNTDVFVVAAGGGEPRRLTAHPGVDVVQGFTPDSCEVLFSSQRDVYTRRFWHLFRVSVEGGFPTPYGLPTVYKAALSPDGKKLAYVPLSEAFTQWKNYRGGTAARIWICTLADLSVEQVPQPAGRCNDTDPMWLGNQLYFRSDRAGEFNLFAYDAAAKGVKQLTRHEDFPIQNASAGATKIVYEQAGWLHLFDPASAKSERLKVAVAADLPETRARFASDADYVRSAELSPHGARVALGYRGEIVTLPAEKGDARNLTNTPGANERYPAWSPDGQTLAYVSDESGENQLVLAPQDGHGERRFVSPGGAGFYENLRWSPDGKSLSFIDNSRTLFVLDVASGKSTKVDQEPIYGVYKTLHHAWSPDSKWLAYTLGTLTGFRRVYLYELASATKHELTDGLSDAAEPVFDAGGKYLYLTASTDAGPFLTWFSQASADIEQTNSLYVVVLAKSTPSPLAKPSDEEKVADEKPKKDDDKKDDDKKEDDEKAAAPSVVIDFDGLNQRILALPPERAYYSSLQPGKEGQLFYLVAERGAFSGEPAKSALARFDFESRKQKTLLESVQGFGLAANHEKVLVRTAAGLFVRPLGDSVDTKEGQLAVDSIQVKLEPRSEWAQILDEAWRINRDYFYDPGMHGADWPAMKKKYAQFLPDLTVRGDLSRVIRWMCSELAVGHHRTSGGETLVEAKTVPGGLLGADYAVDGGRYRFAKVFGGLNWTPELRAPLTEPGVDVKAGEYLLAVNGVDLKASEELYARFENSAEKQLELSVGPNADGSGSRTVKVVPIEDEAALRNRDWVEGNIAKVTAATDGRVAYVYVPDTADLGHVYFKRYFFPQSDREALVIDERHNGGGSIADYYLDILRRPYVAHWAMRYGADLSTPQGAIYGPKVMIIDETAGSGGDLLPWMFHKFGFGKLVGRPTWGGLVGILDFPELLDGASVTAPNLAIWTEDEGFTVENVGVPPDIEVEQLPALVAAGHDPQLEKAIEVALAELKANPPKKPVKPPFPVRVRK
ncbi:MAG: peptidase S41 [Planctomycetes bacterium]|nr:peptidase S41 [Planctomycetota bacterium]